MSPPHVTAPCHRPMSLPHVTVSCDCPCDCPMSMRPRTPPPGWQHELIKAEFEAKESAASKGKASTLGIGKTCPDPAGMRTLPDGVKVSESRAAWCRVRRGTVA
eukprot:7382421-Prymnesium_polylepis.3